MTIRFTDVTDNIPTIRYWETPESPEALRSPVPMGVLTFNGTVEVVAKISNDEMVIRLTHEMPSGFAYLPRSISVRYDSDDLTNNYNDNGFMFYGGVPPGTTLWNLTSPGEFIGSGGADAIRVWTTTVGTPKILLQGGNTLGIRVADMAAGASAAGDFFWHHEFYQFQVQQIDKYEVNTPIPVISHVTF